MATGNARGHKSRSDKIDLVNRRGIPDELGMQMNSWGA